MRKRDESYSNKFPLSGEVVACTEIAQAIQWSTSRRGNIEHPVTAYFTTHFGYGGQYTPAKESVHYAVGEVVAVNTPIPRLAGTLKVYRNGTADEGIVVDSSLTYGVTICRRSTVQVDHACSAALTRHPETR